MPATTFGSARLRLAVLGMAGAAALLLLVQGPQPCDDAYITFRHAKHLAQDLRPAWNLSGPPVLGTTSPAMLALLAPPAALIGADRIPSIALWVNALLLALIVVLAYLVALDLTERPLPALLAAALVGSSSVNIYVFSLGFENALLTAVLLGGLLLARRKRHAAALILASVAPLVRPEGILLSLPVWGHIAMTRSFRWRQLPAYGALPLIWLVAATAYYGSPLPQPLRAKQTFTASHRPYDIERVDLTARLLSLPVHAAALWVKKADPVLFSGSLRTRRPTLRHQLTRWIALAGLPWMLAGLIRRRDERLIYLLYPPLFLLLYGWIGHTLVWYWPSFVTLSILALFSGCAITLDRLARRLNASRFRAAELATVTVFALFVASSAWGWGAPPSAAVRTGPIYAREPRGERWRETEAVRLERYRRAAEYLNARSSGRESALTSEVGVFGFYFRGPVIDAVGLCSPESLAFYPPPREEIYDESGSYRVEGNNFTPTDLVLTLRPDYLVNSLAFSANLLREGSAFPEAYEKLHELPEIWSAPLVIFGRASPHPRSPLPLVAHAGGGLATQDARRLDYSNSRQALDRAYARGHRLFELDFRWTSDDALVALHDWDDVFVRLFDAEAGRRSLAEFHRLDSRHDLEHLDLAGVLEWVAAHPDARVVTDIKQDNLRGLERIRRVAGPAQQRFIPQIYRTGQWGPARELGYRDIILTLYRTELSDDALLRWVGDASPFAITMPPSRGRTGLPSRLDALGTFVYVHTINDPDVAAELYGQWRVDGVYTDELAPGGETPDRMGR